MRKKFEKEDVKAPVLESKLIITNFQGTVLDSFRFWNQFKTEFDKQKISNVTEFLYLKEFLNFQVRKLIDGLPFTLDGYARAKSILRDQYGK